MTTLQKYLNQLYPTKKDKEKIKKIDIFKINEKRKNQGITEKLEGKELDLSEYPNLEEVFVERNYLKSPLIALNVSNCIGLTSLDCNWNQLTNLNLINNVNLKKLLVTDNNFPEQDLSMFSHLVNLEDLRIDSNPFADNLKFLRGMEGLNYLDIRFTDLNSGLEYLPENLTMLLCTGWFAEQLKDYAKQCGDYSCYNYQSWRKDNLYSYLINKVEARDEKISQLQDQLSETNLQLNQTIDQLNNANTQLDSWQSHFFLPQLTWNQPNSVVTFRTQINSIDVVGTAGLCYLLYKGYRKCKLRREIYADGEQQPLLSNENKKLKEQLGRCELEKSHLQSKLNKMEEHQQAQILQQQPYGIPSSSKPK